MKPISEAYSLLRSLKLVRSQYDFSENWLGRGRSYYSSAKAAGREVSGDALLTLYVKLDLLADELGTSPSYASNASLREASDRVDDAAYAVWIAIQQRSIWPRAKRERNNDATMSAGNHR